MTAYLIVGLYGAIVWLCGVHVGKWLECRAEAERKAAS
jgi:hypothetical protein